MTAAESSAADSEASTSISAAEPLLPFRARRSASPVSL